jgi:SanA protein
MFKRLIKTILRLALILLPIGLLALGLPRLISSIYANTRVYPAADVPQKRVAIVFGAGLLRDGSPTPILQDRVEKAAELYFAGKVEKLLMSGDNRFTYYNEPGAMHNYAIKLGVPEDAIVLDYAGRRTYDTCYRAQAIFDVKEAVLVTQSFHLPRALLTCNLLGVKAVGVAADQRAHTLNHLFYWNLRELPATLTAFWDIFISHPLPVLGQQEPIYPPSS